MTLVTWLDSLDEKSIDCAEGTFKNVVKEAWEERQMFLFEHGIAPIKPSLVPKRDSKSQEEVHGNAAADAESRENFRKVMHGKTKTASTSVHESAPNDAESRENFRNVVHEKPKTASTSVHESAPNDAESRANFRNVVHEKPKTAATSVHESASNDAESRANFRKVVHEKPKTASTSVHESAPNDVESRANFRNVVHEKSKAASTNPVSVVQKMPPPIPQRSSELLENAETKTTEHASSGSESIVKRQEDIEEWGLDTLKKAIAKKTNKNFVDAVGIFKGVITSHHESGYSVLENADAFTLVITDPSIKKATYRSAEIKIDTHKISYRIHLPKIQPATFEEAKDDLKYVGPTWLDKQFNNPSSVVSPEVLGNIDTLKRERLRFLRSLKVLKENETPLIKDLRKAEKRHFIISEIEEKTKLKYQPNAKNFSGNMYKKEAKLRGGTYIVVSNKRSFVVLSADRDLRKQKGKDVTLSKVEDKNGRTRIKATPNKKSKEKSKDRGGWER